MKSQQKYSYLPCWVRDDQRFRYRKAYSVNPLYLKINKINGCIEEMNRNNYLILVPANES